MRLRARGARRRITAALTACALLAGLAACADPGDAAETTIALLLPEATTTRYERLDRPLFEERLGVHGSYRVIYANAGQDAARQQEQAESALAAGAAVLVVDPVDSAAAAAIVDSASALGVPVVAYDRKIDGGASFYVSFDNEAIGGMQATAMVDELDRRGADGGVLVLGGSPTDPNSDQLAAGADPVLSASPYPVLARYEVPGWSPSRAQEWITSQLTRFGDEIVGIYAANDALAGGAVAALQASATPIAPVITGQDAELAAIRRVVAGEQHLTVFKNIAMQARIAADAAKALAAGEEPTSWDEVDGVPAVVLEPVLVTAENVDRVIVSTGLYTIEDICIAELRAACERQGIS